MGGQRSAHGARGRRKKRPAFALSSTTVCLALIAAAPPGADAPRDDLSRALALFEAHTFADRPGAPVLRYRLMPPPSDSTDPRFPLVLYLHGAGERGEDNAKQLAGFPALMALPDCRAKYPCFVVAPQCPTGQQWTGKADELALLVDELVRTRPIDPRRIYLTGFSMGAFGAWALAAFRPEIFAAVVPVSGGGDETLAASLASVPIWAVHGENDHVVPVDESRRMVKAILEAGGRVQYRQLSGVGHSGAARDVYRADSEVLAWMFAQRKPFFVLAVDWPTGMLLVLDVALVLALGAMITRRCMRKRSAQGRGARVSAPCGDHVAREESPLSGSDARVRDAGDLPKR